jgi:hypothetical protein
MDMGPSHGPMSCRDFALIDGDVSSIRKGAIVYGTYETYLTPLVSSLATYIVLCFQPNGKR